MTIAVIVILLWVVTGAGAHPIMGQTQGQGGSAVTAVVSVLLQYQGRLTDPATGQAVPDGTYTMTFRLYTVAEGGAALWTEAKDVAVLGGLFSTALGDTTALSHSLFNGQALWLGVKVGSDAEAVPRQPVLAGAYALGLVPGATIVSSSSSALLTVTNSGAGPALQTHGPVAVDGNLTVSGSLSGGSHAHSGADITSGTVADARIASTIARDSEIMSTVLGGDGAGSGLDADLLDGQQASSFAAAAHDHWGASWTGSGTGLSLSGGSIGLYGSGSTYGLYGYSSATDGRGVLGYASAASGNTYAVWGYNSSTSGRGVYGEAASNTGVTYGVYGRTYSPDGYGVYGYTNDDTGYGVYGYAAGTTGYAFGTYGRSDSVDGRGMWGFSSASTGSGIGVGGGSMSGYGLYTPGNLYVGGTCTGCTVLFVGRNAGQETLLVGEAVAVTGVGEVLQGHTTPVLQVRRATPADAAVLGVVHSRGEFYPMPAEQPEVGDIVQPGQGDVAPGDYVLVVTGGLARVRLAPDLVSLTPGQSLTVAAGAGRATLATAETRPELVFGRAMEARPDGQGLLWALIATR
jgi:hypothetical protein